MLLYDFVGVCREVGWGFSCEFGRRGVLGSVEGLVLCLSSKPGVFVSGEESVNSALSETVTITAFVVVVFDVGFLF